MPKIIVFTNYSSLAGVDENFASCNELYKLSEKTPLIYFNEDSSSFQQLEDFIKDGLYLVLDSIPPETFTNLTENITPSEILILKHRKPDFDFKKFDTKDGVHESGDKGRYYPDLVEILGDSKGEKLNRIIKEVFKFDPDYEDNLNLLISLFPENSSKELDTLIEKHKQEISIDNIKGKSYNEKLTLLRIALLGS